MEDINKEDIQKLADEFLEAANGGTVTESARLCALLLLAGKGFFGKKNKDRNDICDIEKLQKFFASKGYKFIPGFGDQPNVFIGPDGLPYGNDYMCMLIQERKI
jgi:hypothetical protein